MAVYVAATRQHVGKTSSSLGLVSAIISKLGSCGFIKPVGQRHVTVDGVRVDKDVKLFKEHFNLSHDYADMSPVVIPSGFVKDYIDGKTHKQEHIQKIDAAYERIRSQAPFTVVEGTGHCGVGSVIDLNNAQVAAHLGVPIMMVVNGGIGSAFDELANNIAVCEAAGADIAGVLMNKVDPARLEQARDYFGRAIHSRWGLPLFGCVPFVPIMEAPAVMDLEALFETKLLSGHKHSLSHFAKYELAITDLNIFMKKLASGNFDDTLFITHVSRSDIISGYLTFAHAQQKRTGQKLKGGFLLTGSTGQPWSMFDNLQDNQPLKDCIEISDIPILPTNKTTNETLKAMSDYVAKLSSQDSKRTNRVVEHYKEHIDLDAMLSRIGN